MFSMLLQVQLNCHFPSWPLSHHRSHTRALSWSEQWLQPPECSSIKKRARAQGVGTADLPSARAEEKATFMIRSGGQITAHALQGELSEN